MRASELIGARVVDDQGRAVGIVRDLRVEVGSVGSGHAFPVAGIVVGLPGARSAAAHRWGYAERRAAGPAIFRRLLQPAVERSILIPVERVADWGPGVVRIR